MDIVVTDRAVHPTASAITTAAVARGRRGALGAVVVGSETAVVVGIAYLLLPR